MRQEQLNLESVVFSGKDITCKESKLIALTKLSLFYMPKDDNGPAMVRINLEFQGLLIGNPESRMLLNEEWGNNRNAYRKYCEIKGKLERRKYELDLDLPSVADPSIKFL